MHLCKVALQGPSGPGAVTGPAAGPGLLRGPAAPRRNAAVQVSPPAWRLPMTSLQQRVSSHPSPHSAPCDTCCTELTLHQQKQSPHFLTIAPTFSCAAPKLEGAEGRKQARGKPITAKVLPSRQFLGGFLCLLVMSNYCRCMDFLISLVGGTFSRPHLTSMPLTEDFLLASLRPRRPEGSVCTSVLVWTRRTSLKQVV